MFTSDAECSLLIAINSSYFSRRHQLSIAPGPDNNNEEHQNGHAVAVGGDEPLEQDEAEVQPTDHDQVLFFPDEHLANPRLNSAHGPLRALIELIRSATKSLDMCLYSFTYKTLVDEVIKLREDWDRNVHVRLITDFEADTEEDSQLSALRKCGVEVRKSFRSDADRGRLMHHKFVIIDAHTLLNGSFNWTRQGVTINHENILVTREPSLVDAYQQQFEKLWSEFQVCGSRG